jgi:hypothetical protein
VDAAAPGRRLRLRLRRVLDVLDVDAGAAVVPHEPDA